MGLNKDLVNIMDLTKPVSYPPRDPIVAINETAKEIYENTSKKIFALLNTTTSEPVTRPDAMADVEETTIQTTSKEFSSTLRSIVGLNDSLIRIHDHENHKEEHASFPWICVTVIIVIVVLLTIFIVLYVRTRKFYYPHSSVNKTDRDQSQQPDAEFKQVSFQD